MRDPAVTAVLCLRGFLSVPGDDFYVSEEGVAALAEKFKTLIADNAELGEVDEWGKRRLAYPNNDEPDGFYVLYNVVSTPEFPAELDRVSKITDGVLRSLIVRKDK